MRWRWVYILALLALIPGCGRNPWTVVLEQRMDAVPEAYVGWFLEVADCLDMPREATLSRFSRISWHTGSDIYNTSEDLHAWGLWESRHKITIHTAHVREAWVVKHEIIHDLLGRGGHPEPVFSTCARA